MNPYVPEMGKILGVKRETPDVKTFHFSLDEEKEIKFTPGQVIMVSVLGFGESTFGIIPTGRRGVYEFGVKKTGIVTNRLFRLKKGDRIGIRGPFGNGYPIKDMKGKNVIMVAGGIGSPPIKSLLINLLEKRDCYGRIELYYGARTPEDIVYKSEMKEWGERKDIKVGITVDKKTGGWKGNVGVITTLLEDLIIDSKTAACLCGPCIMSKFVCKKLLERGLEMKRIYVSIERLMQCGMGHCGHCNIGKLYVCKDGPVFRLDELDGLTEKVW